MAHSNIAENFVRFVFRTPARNKYLFLTGYGEDSAKRKRKWKRNFVEKLITVCKPLAQPDGQIPIE